MNARPAIYTQRKTTIERGQIVRTVEKLPVNILAIAHPWAMVRRPRAHPFVCHVRDLSEA